MSLSTTDQLITTKTNRGVQADLVIDVGLYTGEDTAYYLHKGYRVVSIDANPLMIERARKRFAAEIAANRLTLLNVGIFRSSGNFDFWISSHEDWSSFDKGNASKLQAEAHSISIPCLPFTEILKSHGVPFYLKIDIEKLDGVCLAALTPECRPQYVSWEASIDSLDELEIMRRLGYNAFKCIDQMTLRSAALASISGHPRLHALRRTLNLFKRPNRGDWKFEKGLTSGPFGEETDGRWRTYDELAAEFGAFCKKNPDDEQWPSWFDFHATIKVS